MVLENSEIKGSILLFCPFLSEEMGLSGAMVLELEHELTSLGGLYQAPSSF